MLLLMNVSNKKRQYILVCLFFNENNRQRKDKNNKRNEIYTLEKVLKPPSCKINFMKAVIEVNPLPTTKSIIF